MLFCAWLHAAFLEHDEPSEISRQLNRSNKVMVVFDRFSVDKAAGAPPLRCYSSAFRVELEFEVEQRIAWRDDYEDPAAHNALLATKHGMQDCYDLGWLTWVSEKVWPSFRGGLERLIREDIMPGVVQALPGPLKNIRLTQCSFGNAFPKFGPISAMSRTHDGLEVQLDIFLDYSTATNIVLDASIASFSISHLKIADWLSVKFKPILDELPVLAAIQFWFLTPPVLT